MQLEYTKAHQHLLTAIRKAPQQTAVGFRQNVRFELNERTKEENRFLGVQISHYGLTSSR